VSTLRYGVRLAAGASSYYVVVGTVLPEGFDARANSLTRALATVTQLDRFQDIFRLVLVGFYLAFSLPILLVAILLSFLISDELILPIVNLVEATRRVTEGDFSFRVLTRQEDELAVLVASFNQMIAQLETSRRKLLQAEKISAWQEIAQRLAHEIKNPLTPIKLSAERIARTHREQPAQLATVIESAVRAITTEVDNLDRMLVEFREFARLPEPSLRSCALAPLLEDVIDLYRSAASGVVLSITDVPADIELQLDAAQMKRAFGNLVSNAIGAVDTEGEVSIRTDHVHKGGRDLWRTQVRDNGAGIAEEDRDHIFEPYFTTRPDGHGLGLAIVERIVFDHGGNIWFESEPGHGTTFFVDLPAGQPAAPAT
jgi:nitrogen fixation/metabolism regulation signal transduction histidine kinase